MPQIDLLHNTLCFYNLYFLSFFLLAIWPLFSLSFTDTHSGGGRWEVVGTARDAFVWECVFMCVCASVSGVFVKTEFVVFFPSDSPPIVTRFSLRLSARTFSNWTPTGCCRSETPCSNPDQMRWQPLRAWQWLSLWLSLSLPFSLGEQALLTCKSEIEISMESPCVWFPLPASPHRSHVPHLVPLTVFMFWSRQNRGNLWKSFSRAWYPLYGKH